MYEIDFLPVGDGGRSGDAIAVRFNRPDTGALAHVIVDAGFKDDGEALVEHVKTYYQTDSVDIAILTHPDGDHIGGMGEVLRGLNVGELWLHHLGSRGGGGLPAADAVDELIEVAQNEGTRVAEAFAGAQAFGGALTILGPTVDYYEQLVAEQQLVSTSVAGTGRAASFGATVTVLAQRFLAALPVEVPFGDAGGTSPRNNTSMVTLLQLEGQQLLLTADAGVPALDRALDWADENGMTVYQPAFTQLPHHGSRHNASSALLDRILGSTRQAQTRTAFVNVVEEAEKHPSPRVANGFMRRGYAVGATRGKAIQKGHNAPTRPGWTTLVPLQPLDESLEDDD
ncbi:MAG: MBL fold metallo-hydrolase [Gaiellaceae bacterium]